MSLPNTILNDMQTSDLRHDSRVKEKILKEFAGTVTTTFKPYGLLAASSPFEFPTNSHHTKLKE